MTLTTNLNDRIGDLLQRALPRDTHERTVAITECYQGTLTLLRLVHGGDSSQERVLSAAAKAASRWAGEPVNGLEMELWPAVEATLRSLKADLEAGLAGRIELRVSGGVLADFLGLAREALGEGTDDAKNVAAVLVAAAFEDTIRRMGESLASVEGRPNLSEVLNALKRSKVLDGAPFSTAQSYLKFRNDALHADWAKLDTSVTVSCLAFTESLLIRYFA